MNVTRRNTITASLAAWVTTLLLCVFTTGDGLSQTPPGYNELFRDPPRTDSLTPADLPNLGRLVALEAISMFVHARSELRSSPESAQLLAEITTLWNAADAFTSAVSDYPQESQRIEAGRLTLPQLETAFYQVKQTQGSLPHIGPRTAENLSDMSRVMAVLGPLLQQGTAEAAATVHSRAPTATTIASQAHDLASAIVPLKNQIRVATVRGSNLDTLDRELDVLQMLLQGFERISSSGVDEGDLVASFRPIQRLAQRVRGNVQRANLGATGTKAWQSIDEQLDALETRFQVPREIVPRLAQEQAASVNPAIFGPSDRAIRDLDTLVDRITSQNSRVPQLEQVRSSARALTTRLLLLRQHLLGQAPREQVNQALVEADLAWHQLESRMTALGQPYAASLQTLRRDINEAVASAHERISKRP